MATTRKIKKAHQVAASDAYTRLRQSRGKVRFSCTLAELKFDR